MKQFKTTFDIHLSQWLKEKQTQLDSFLKDVPFGLLMQGVEDLALAPGKRVRPYIASLGYAGVSSDDIIDWQPFLALELFHVFGLIHDDIIDVGDVRRGIDTLHKQVESQYNAEQRVGNIQHLGESQAMLMGDLVHMWCHELFDTSDYALESLLQAKELFRKMSRDVMIGQMIDVDIMSSEAVTMERIMQKMKLKTASYTFVYPMQIGVALGGETDQILFDQIDRFGTALGIAFQIQDDMMDMYGDVEELGKTSLRDIVDGEHTLLTQYIFESGTDEEKNILESLFRTELSPDEQTQVRELFVSSCAKAYAEAEVTKQLSVAREVLVGMKLNEKVKKDIGVLVDYLEGRKI